MVAGVGSGSVGVMLCSAFVVFFSWVDDSSVVFDCDWGL